MANVDAPRGFEAVRHFTGGQIRSTKCVVKTGSTIYKGDPVIMDATGTVLVAASGDTNVLFGVAAEYVTDSTSAAGLEINIYTDPFIVYKVQTTDSLTTAAASLYATSDMITYAAGNSSTGRSIMELNTPGTSSGQFLIIGLWESPDNAWGEFSKVEVLFNQHEVKAGAGAASAGL